MLPRPMAPFKVPSGPDVKHYTLFISFKFPSFGANVVPCELDNRPLFASSDVTWRLAASPDGLEDLGQSWGVCGTEPPPPALPKCAALRAKRHQGVTQGALRSRHLPPPPSLGSTPRDQRRRLRAPGPAQLGQQVVSLPNELTPLCAEHPRGPPAP